MAVPNPYPNLRHNLGGGAAPICLKFLFPHSSAALWSPETGLMNMKKLSSSLCKQPATSAQLAQSRSFQRKTTESCW